MHLRVTRALEVQLDTRALKALKLSGTQRALGQPSTQGTWVIETLYFADPLFLIKQNISCEPYKIYASSLKDLCPLKVISSYHKNSFKPHCPQICVSICPFAKKANDKSRGEQWIWLTELLICPWSTLEQTIFLWELQRSWNSPTII